ncbi:hypothetical protein RB597_005670 [Gaeumannomyces tritici]
MQKFTPDGKQKIAAAIFAKKPGESEPGNLSAYFNLLDDLAQKGIKFKAGDIWQTPDPELGADRSLHENVLETAAELKRNPNITKEGAIQHVRAASSTASGRPWARSDSELDMVVNLAVQAVAMVDSSARDWHASDFTRGGHRPTSWQPGDSFVDFLDRSFPLRTEKRDGGEDEDLRVKVALAEKSKLKAWKLKRRLGLEIRATDNLSEHLLLDVRKNHLYLFHHAAFLKAHLEMYQGDDEALAYDMPTSLKRGTLPPRLLLETLHSLQDIIFPSIDDVSADMLDRLIKRERGAFDAECANYEGYKLFGSRVSGGGGDTPAGFIYLYWGKRLTELHGLLDCRLPRNKLERWLYQQSSDGNALFVALAALLISIIVGVLAILLSVAQLVIAYLAWKNPVAPPSA